MYRRPELRRLLEARVAEHGDNHSAGLARFVEDVYVMLGLKRQQGEGQSTTFTECRDEHGDPCFAEGRAKPHEFSLRAIGEAIYGRDGFDQAFGPQGGGESTQAIIEAGVGIDPTAHLNINAFSLVTAGLYQAQVMESLENPAFIGDALSQVRPTRHNGEKMIRVSSVGSADDNETRFPGQPHSRAGMQEEYIETPELTEKAMAVELTQEIVFHDLTGQVLDRARAVGEHLGYIKERAKIDLALGVTNTYVYNGTSYDTYLAGPDTLYVNQQANPLVDYRSFQTAKSLFRAMKDPATGKEILVMPTTVLHHTDREDEFFRVLNQTEVRETTGSTVTLSPPPPAVTRNKPSLLSSPIMDNRMTAEDGLGLSLENARANWWYGDFAKAFAWMQAWDVRVQPASATEKEMIDRGLIAAFFSNYRATGAVLEPRYVSRQTN